MQPRSSERGSDLSKVAQLVTEELGLESASAGLQNLASSLGFSSGGGREGELDQAGCQRAPKLTLSPPTWVFTKLESQRQPGNCLPYPPKSCHSLPSKYLHQAFPSSFNPTAGALGQTLLLPSFPPARPWPKPPWLASCLHQPHYSLGWEVQGLSRMPT